MERFNHNQGFVCLDSAVANIVYGLKPAGKSVIEVACLDLVRSHIKWMNLGVAMGGLLKIMKIQIVNDIV